ncbi:MAG: diguanylate cyclase domain-containing protein [Halanaerobiales bacterium]
MVNLYDLFRHENQVLDRITEILSSKDEDSCWYREYKSLATEYKKFLNEMELIFSVSDKNHKLIKKIQQKLEAEIAEKKETEQELEEKIEKLSDYKKRLEGANKKLLKLSSHDDLTGLPNRRRFEEFIKELKLSPRLSSQHISFIMIDIDYFKDFNDFYGHIEGDKCLQEVANRLLELPRLTDFVARYGGEEFIVVLPNLDYDNASNVAERIRKNIEKAEIPHEKSSVSDYVTVSLGVSTVKNIREFTVDEIVDSADKMLYHAKESGRNQVKVDFLNREDEDNG